jgi:U3 small nucleolar RNA-associated protein 11
MQGASTMRNAVKRVTHKERAQPKSRKRFGLLEKHKDYIERANDFKKKKSSLKILKKKAADRNPDEFYHNMHNSQVTNGVHNIKRDGSLTNATVQLLKTQDMGYLVHRKSIDDRKAEQLRNDLHMIGDKIPRKHKIFVDDTSSLDTFDVAKHFNTAPELVDRAFNRISTEKIEKLVQNSDSKSTTLMDLKKALEKRTKAYKELKARNHRSEKLKKVITGLALQRNLMGKGSKKKIPLKTSNTDDNIDDSPKSRKRKGEIDGPTVYKWKRERSR